MKPINIIVSVDEAAGVGKHGKLPWESKKSFVHFNRTTKDAVCIMGRKTYEEFLEKSKTRKNYKSDLLPGRTCYVLSRNDATKLEGGCIRLRSLRNALEEAEQLNKSIFVIGGERLFVEALPWTNTIHMTLLEGEYGCDRFFPLTYLTKYFKITDGKRVTEDKKEVKFITYTRGA